jgi:hypothetical protein
MATDATGGVLVIPPYTLVYGSNGLVQWSVPAKPLDFTNAGSGAARVTDQKIVKALALRGGGGFSPSALLWSLDSVIRMYFVGGAPVFAFDILSDTSSILSYQAVVNVEGVFYWMGKDRFLMYNGVLQEVPNPRNINFFFDNLNTKYAQKAFAVRNPRWGEIWFCAPLFGATEPNWAVIYNHRENLWYDTPLPNSGRSAAVFNEITSPGLIMSGVDVFGTNNTYRLWQHEVGTDQVDGATTSAVKSYFTTGLIAPSTFQQPLDKTLTIDTMEPDLLQSGDMTLNVLARANSKDPYQTVNTQTIYASPPNTATGSFNQVVPSRESARQVKLQFVSNVAGGSFEMGRTLAHVAVDTARRL